jgi:restriction system protein
MATELPTYEHFIEPLLRFLASQSDAASARDCFEAVAEACALSDEQRSLLLPSRAQPTYQNRIGWAHDRLKRAGLSSSPSRGRWLLTEAGRSLAAKKPGGLSASEVSRIAQGFKDKPAKKPGSAEVQAQSEVPLLSRQSPEELLDAAISEIRRAVADEVREELLKVTPAQFEATVLDVLHRMGYGADRSDLSQVGRSGDGGIDGIISLDKLGFEKVYVQAKRWKDPVGRPEVQAFYGALAGLQAKKGVVITTSTFSQPAIEYARSVPGIVLVDGARLAELMMDHEVGVTSRPVQVPRLDRDYFEP